jgi:tetratricopeptide (TPR) repeat protein
VILKRQRALPVFFATAIVFLSSLLAVGPTSTLTKGSVGYASRADQAIAPPTDTDALAEAKSLLAQGKADDADRAVRAYLETHPSSADAHFLRGYILFRQIQTHAVTSGEAAPNSYREPGAHAPNAASLQSTAEASLAEFTEGAKYHPPSAFDLKIVALDYVLLNDYVDADKWLTRSLQWNPKDADTWYYLGRAKYNENRFADAVQCFQQVLKLDAKNVKAQDNLGLSYEGLGQTDAAMAAYQTAIAWQSDSAVKNPGPLLDLGILLMEQNRTQEAVPYLTQAVTIAPKEPRHHEELGKAYLRLEEWQKAQAELETAVALSPQNSRLHYLLGRVYSKEGLAEKAKEEFARSETLKAAESTASPQARP